MVLSLGPRMQTYRTCDAHFPALLPLSGPRFHYHIPQLVRLRNQTDGRVVMVLGNDRREGAFINEKSALLAWLAGVEIADLRDPLPDRIMDRYL